MNHSVNPRDPSLPISELLAVHKVCQQFEAEWKAGRQPQAADYLGTTPEPQRSELRRELEALESDYRRRAPKPTLEAFTQKLADSGLMTRAEVQAFLTALPADKRPADAEALARELFRQGKLTRFQAQAVFQGKTRGLVVGNYVVLEKLGQGGMGQVYKAQHRKMKRIVALKMLPPTSTRSPEAVQRFQREVEAAAKLAPQHRHGPRRRRSQRPELPGDGTRRRPRPPGDRAGPGAAGGGPSGQLPVQAARGLEYAHCQGVVHRDVKPSNLLLEKSGAVKILDMGLARIEDAVGAADHGLTHSGQVLGTLDYMAPEQALDTRLADARSDVYSLGCTLYYLLTGKPPFTGDTVTKKILAHQNEAIPSLRAVRPDVPETLDAIFQRMLAKRAADRPRSMAALVAELSALRVAQHAQPAARAAAAAEPADTESFLRPGSMGHQQLETRGNAAARGSAAAGGIRRLSSATGQAAEDRPGRCRRHGVSCGPLRRHAHAAHRGRHAGNRVGRPERASGRQTRRRAD